MPPLHTQFDQTLIGLGIYIPSSPSSSSAALLSPPAAFHTPQRQRSAPRTLGTRNGFRPSPALSLPRSIYAGEDNPFLPDPSDVDEAGVEADEVEAEEVDETSEELRLPGHLKRGRRRSKEYDAILQGEVDDLDNLPESTFPQSQSQSRPESHLLSPAFVARSDRYIPRSRRNLGSSPGADPSSAGQQGPGPDPFYASDEALGIPQTPRPPLSPSVGAETPSTPIPSASVLASPVPPTPTVGGGGRALGLVASALAEEIPPTHNPLFAASIALSVLLGVLIVGIVTCTVAYCRRGKRGVEEDEEKNGRAGGGPASPKRSLEGVYARGLGTPTRGLRSSDTLTSFSTRTSTTLADSRPGSVLKSPIDAVIPSAPGAGEETAGGEAEGGRVSFVEMLSAPPNQAQLYSPPKWQPGQSSPLAQAAPILPPQTPVDNPSPPPSPTRRTPPGQASAVDSSSSRQSMCAVPPLDSIAETEESVDSHADAAPPSHPSSALLHPSYSTTSTSLAHSQEPGSEEGESASGSYHSCSDNSSMTTHASDDAFGYTSRSSSMASVADSAFGPAKSLASFASFPSLGDGRDRTSVASSVPSFDYPLYLIDDIDELSEMDMSFDTLSSLSLSTPRASPSPPPGLDSPLPLHSAMGGGERRKTIDWMGSPSVRQLRARFAVDDDEESESGSEGEDDEEDVGGAEVVQGTSTKVLYLPTTATPGETKRPLSLPTRPIPASASKSVLKRALSALRSNSPSPSSLPLSDLPYGPPTPPRRSPSRPSPSSAVIIHQSDIDARGQPTHTSSLPTSSSSQSLSIGRFSTASWDQLGQGAGFDAYYLGYDGASSAGLGLGMWSEHQERSERDEDGDEGEGEEGEEEGDIMDIMAELNQARISFGFLSSDGGHGYLDELREFPEPANHLPHIRVTSH